MLVNGVYFYEDKSNYCTVNITGNIDFIFLNPHWITNDDPGMLMIVSGQYSGSPDPHIIFSNIILGKLLAYLFTLNMFINWYTIFHFVILYISLSVISFSILSKSKNSQLLSVATLIIISIIS